MPSILTSLKGLLSVGVTVVVLGGTLVWLGTDGEPGSGGGNGSGEVPGGDSNGSGASGDEGADGDGAASGGSGPGGGSSSGASSAGAGNASAATDGSGNGSDGPGPDGDIPSFPPPPPGGLCGPHEFLGGLIPFINGLGDPNLLDRPPWLENLSDFADFLPFDTGPIAGPFLGALGTPATVIGGFNEAYGMIADELPEECSMIGGDPHIVTHDRRRYDFQSVGEYWAFRSDDTAFGVQIKTLPYQNSGRASTVVGVAAQVDGQLLVVDTTADDLVTFDGEPLAIDGVEFSDNGGGVFYLEDGVAVYWPDSQTTMSVTHLERPILTLHFTIGEALRGQVSGLMGNADGSLSNDLALPDGTAVDDDFETVHAPYRDAWRVAANDAWFAGPSVFRDDFPTAEALLTAAERTAARIVCVEAGVVSGSLLENCMYDVAVSGEPEIAGLHALDQRQRTGLLDSACQLTFDGGQRYMQGFSPARLWQTNVPIRLDVEAAWQLASPDGADIEVSRAIVTGDTALVVDVNNGLHRIDAAGEILQSFELAAQPGVEPLVAGEAIFVATEEGVAGVTADGNVCWQLLTHGDEQLATLAMAGSTIIATTEADDGAVSLALALDPATGRILWQKPLQANVQQFGARLPPAFTEGVGYFESAGGAIMALRLEDGEMLWSYEPERQSNAITGLSATAAGLVVVSRTNGISLLATASGDVLWQIASNVGVPRALAVGESHAVVVGERSTKAVLLDTGEVAWNHDGPRVGGGSDPQPVVVQGIVYASGRNRQLFGIDIATGEERARLNGSPEDGSSSPYTEFVGQPMMLGDTLLTISQQGDLEAFR